MGEIIPFKPRARQAAPDEAVRPECMFSHSGRVRGEYTRHIGKVIPPHEDTLKSLMEEFAHELETWRPELSVPPNAPYPWHAPRCPGPPPYSTKKDT